MCNLINCYNRSWGSYFLTCSIVFIVSVLLFCGVIEFSNQTSNVEDVPNAECYVNYTKIVSISNSVLFDGYWYVDVNTSPKISINDPYIKVSNVNQQEINSQFSTYLVNHTYNCTIESDNETNPQFYVINWYTHPSQPDIQSPLQIFLFASGMSVIIVGGALYCKHGLISIKTYGY